MDTFEDLVFFRGMSARYPIDRPSINTPRSDRRPKNSSESFHEAADAWFLRQFGIAYRSRALFVCSRKLTAQAYGASPDHVMRILPLTKYQYCWSPKVSDLLFAANRYAEFEPSVVDQYLDGAEYRQDGLADAHRAGHEVMLFCERFIAIPSALCESDASSNPTSIVLVTG